MSFPTQNDLNDLQGDVILGFPKRVEDFIFFVINDAAAFKKNLAQLIPTITTTAQVQKIRKDIDDHKLKKLPGLLKVQATNIAFTKEGLAKLGASESLGDNPFNNTMLKDAQKLGDTGTTKPDGTFDPAWTGAFKNPIDGVILVAGDSKLSIEATVTNIKLVLGKSFKEVLKVDGVVRPGKEKGHEHFGFLDGVSNPGIESLTGILPGQIPVKPGFLICGQDGDTVTRPAWTKNGSFLVYRQLSQLVPEFDKFLTDNPIVIDGLSREDGSKLAGARMIGRWKSGAPIDVTPTKDDQELADDPKRNNFFNFGPNLTDQTKCPFSAHIRKTNPRQDILSLPGANIDSLGQRLMMRNGIPFGPEVSIAENLAHKTLIDRGLAFVAYQSNIEKGFEFVQESWANTENFPPAKPVNAGFDPIIGQKNGQPRTFTGLQVNSPAGTTSLPMEFVVSKGGSYFFVPSLSALKTKLTV